MKAVKPVYVLDACALLRLAQDEPGAERVADILVAAQAGEARVLLHQINLGEVVYRIAKGFGYAVAERKRAEIKLLPIETVAFSDDIFWAAVKLKSQYAMSYADCFAAALVRREQAVLLSSDPEFGVLGDALTVLKV
ncbi:type II toxin-antitoxin system VapC family toxin [Methylovulum miyakonense]|uniref:type II toxin-antitoxin system VapC family toxin n=1 Tax=Methylovulum miyakonense TaxID=645578 RepID=UPI00037162FB|nr:type II toxin-antitoxin system VapC family toxin [Methylovulum miyakonense]